jgi:hypothetical protein
VTIKADHPLLFKAMERSPYHLAYGTQLRRHFLLSHATRSFFTLGRLSEEQLRQERADGARKNDNRLPSWSDCTLGARRWRRHNRLTRRYAISSATSHRARQHDPHGSARHDNGVLFYCAQDLTTRCSGCGTRTPLFRYR